MLALVLATAGAFYIYHENPKLVKHLFPSPEKRERLEGNYNFVPQVEPGENALRAIWKEPNWHPEDWDQNVYHTRAVLGRFIDADIIYNSYFKDGRYPIVKVGPNFYHLSHQDQTNVMAYMDKAFAITGRSGSFEVKDWRSGRTVATYSNGGLFLQ